DRGKHGERRNPQDPTGEAVETLPRSVRAGCRRPLDGHPRGRDRDLRRSVGVRQDDDDEDDQPDHRTFIGADH
ncbi:MAG: L-proline glycine betaine ABC transport system permease protein ProV, partial [uncultured Nocardioidaceae bacterium]